MRLLGHLFMTFITGGWWLIGLIINYIIRKDK